jgi:hypothetical protein
MKLFKHPGWYAFCSHKQQTEKSGLILKGKPQPSSFESAKKEVSAGR